MKYEWMIVAAVAVMAQPAPAAAQSRCKVPHTIEFDVADEHLESRGSKLTAPTTRLCAGDTIVWHISNTTNEPVKVKLHTFKDKTSGSSKSLKFAGSSDVTIEQGYTGVLVAVFPRSQNPGNQAITVSYRVKVKGDSSDREKDHDPDLEVDPPPDPAPGVPPVIKKKK